MLKHRILSTLRFFDFQDYPLTLLELQRFLIANPEKIKKQLYKNFELSGGTLPQQEAPVKMREIIACLEGQLAGEVLCEKGFYYLAGRQSLVATRLKNYLFGIKREKIIKRFLPVLKYFPFIRGAAIGGSQSMGLQKPTSDIDLLLFVEHDYLWLVRPVLVAYFQIFGVRRHGRFISDRICLNHYLTGKGEVSGGKDLYNAMEYLRLRPVVYGQTVNEFCLNNLPWIKCFFPNFELAPGSWEPTSRLQTILERGLKNKFFDRLSGFLKQWQLKRARRGSFVVVTGDELSFHSLERKHRLLAKFFGIPEALTGGIGNSGN